jgi:hypothetical protein
MHLQSKNRRNYSLKFPTLDTSQALATLLPLLLQLENQL